MKKYLRGFDLQDAFLCAGVLSLCAGLGWIYRPAALLAFGLFCLLEVWLMERAPKNEPPPNPNGPPH